MKLFTKIYSSIFGKSKKRRRITKRQNKKNRTKKNLRMRGG
jgi:hypothetical protein